MLIKLFLAIAFNALTFVKCNLTCPGAEALPPFRGNLGCNLLGSVGATFHPDNVTFWLQTPENPDVGKQVHVGDLEGLIANGYSSERGLKVICHGWLSSHDKPLIQYMVKRTFAGEKDVNILVPDYHALDANYLNMYFNRYKIANEISRFLDFLYANKLAKPEETNMVGHSFGAQLIGLAASGVQAENARKMSLVGLDNAEPCFTDPSDRLNKDRADDVSCYFTSELGVNQPDCTRNYFVNGGNSNQPACFVTKGFDRTACSHNAAILYYGESLTYPNKYAAKLCPNSETAKSILLSTVLCKHTGTYLSEKQKSVPEPGSYYVPIPCDDSFQTCPKFACLVGSSGDNANASFRLTASIAIWLNATIIYLFITICV